MIQKMQFGNTGHESSRVIFGAVVLAHTDEDESRRILELLLQHGVNHIDTSTSYGDSEKRLGGWMREYRDRFFLATKVDSRDEDASQREFEESLKKMKTDRVDLLQMHELVRQNDVTAFFDSSGAFRTITRAKEEGTARYVGITGHGYDAPRLLSECLKRYPFDSVLLPYNYALSKNEEYMREFTALVEQCKRTNTAVQTMKAIERSEWGDHEHTRSTWYRPLEDREAIEKAVQWVLGNPTVFTCSPGDAGLLPDFLEAADSFSQPPGEEEMQALQNRYGLHVPPQSDWPRLHASH